MQPPDDKPAPAKAPIAKAGTNTAKRPKLDLTPEKKKEREVGGWDETDGGVSSTLLRADERY